MPMIGPLKVAKAGDVLDKYLAMRLRVVWLINDHRPTQATMLKLNQRSELPL